MRRVLFHAVHGCIAAALLAAGVLPAAAQEFPSRPMRFYVGFVPGTGSDLVSRLLAQKLSERLGQPVIVEQRISSGGILASDAVVKSQPDGHAMALLSGAHPVLAAMRKSLPYDPVRDFGMVSLVSSYPLVITVAVDSPTKTLADLIALFHQVRQELRTDHHRVHWGLDDPHWAIRHPQDLTHDRQRIRRIPC